MEMSSLCLSYHCILEDNVLPDFIGPQWKRILPLDWQAQSLIHDEFTYLDKNLDLF